MKGVAGVEIQAALKKAATWNTAVAAGAGDGLLILPTSIGKDAGAEVDDSLGTYHAKDGDLGAITVEGDLPLYLRYDGHDLPIGLTMGANDGAPVQQEATTAYSYRFKPADDVDDLFATFVKNMKNYIEEIPSLKFAGFTLRGEAGKALQVVFKVIGIDKIADSAVNTSATFVNVTIPEVANRVRFSHGVFLMNDRDDIALADPADRIYPASFEFSYMRSLAGFHTGEYRSSGSAGQELIDEPQNNGAPEIRLKLQFPRHGSNAYLTDLANDTRKKATFTFTGALIESTYYRELKLELPHLQLLNDDPTDEQGAIKEPLEFAVHGVDAAPAGFDFTEPFALGGINKNTVDVLA